MVLLRLTKPQVEMASSAICVYQTHVNTGPVSQGQGLVVSQPSFAKGIEGSSITMHCSYNITREPKVGSYRWMKDSVTEVKNYTREFLGRVTITSHEDFILRRRADIKIQDLRHYDSGTYQCIVEIPGLPETTGNGTELLVIKPGAASHQEDYMILVWLLLRAICCAFGITTVALVTRLYYEKTIPEMDQSGPRNHGKNKSKTARTK
ncbi:natural cytotoxicity triggering receptor 3 [Tiliqua scincoides]|uniref:natural cytotoxicity triggering receptor 3 n=1 Tax=Tiliqua scincoides TaxID=71010 RepID=UPI003462D9EA